MGETFSCNYCGPSRSQRWPTRDALDEHVEKAHMPPYRKDDE